MQANFHTQDTLWCVNSYGKIHWFLIHGKNKIPSRVQKVPFLPRFFGNLGHGDGLTSMDTSALARPLLVLCLAPLKLPSSVVKHSTPVHFAFPSSSVSGVSRRTPPCTPTPFLRPNAPRAIKACPRSVAFGSPMCTQMYLGPPAPGIPALASASQS